MSKYKRLGIVGAGLIGRKHIQASISANNVKIEAVVDVDESAKKIARSNSLSYFSSVEEMLASQELDGVIIATPNNLHIEGALPCINKGIPVLIEKPLSADINEAKEMLSLAQSKNVDILTGFFRRYNPVVSAAKKAISSGEIGDIVSVSCNFWIYKNKDYFDVKWRTEPGAGPIQINLAHEVDLLLYLIGKIDQVTTYTSNKNRNFDIEDSAAIICKFKNGTLGTINMSDTIPSPWSWELTAGDNPDYPQTDQSYFIVGGTKGAIEIPKNKIWYYEGERHWYKPINSKILKKDFKKPLVEQLEHFGRVIDKKEKPIISGYDGLEVMKAINAIKLSAINKNSIFL